MKLLQQLSAGFMVLAAVVLVASPVVEAQSSTGSRLSQQINAGVLSTSIRNASGAVVASPSFSMGAGTVSTSAQTVTGTFGSNDQRITVNNAGAANDGWTLTLNATTPGTGAWTSGSNNYPYNGTAATGQLTVNATPATVTATTGSAATGFTKGTSAGFTGSTAITLLTAADTTNDVWAGYMTGVSLSQVIPAAQPAGTYTLDLTQTVTAS